MFLSTDTSQNAHYAQVPTISHQRNSFSIAETHKTTIQFDYLFPVWHKFTYPGDTINITQHVMARLQTQVTDLFDDLYFDVHAWFVPFRLIQNNWARFQFNTQTDPGQDNTSLTTPRIDFATLPTGTKKFPAKSLYDYFGYPTAANYTSSSQHITNYLGRAYNLIWNENYRDQNLQNSITVDKGDGPDNYANYVLRKRGKRHDKFTSSLPFQQKGTIPSVPILGTAPVTASSVGAAPVWGLTNNGTTDYGLISANSSTGGGFSPTPGATGTAFWKTPNLTANLTTGLSYMLINDLRISASVQQLLEADARGGTRDVESIKHRWGVQVPDYRLQRPEYLGGQTFTFDGHVVPQTSATVSGQTPQANLTSFSQAMNSFSITHSFVEHGVMMILISARSNMTYQQMLNKELTQQTRYDFYQPEFSNLGEVAVRSRELEATGTDATDNQVFGFQEYGYQLRYGDNKVTSEMRSSYPQTLDSKHMAYNFAGTPPALSSTFIESTTPIDRNIVVASGTSDPIRLNTLVTGHIARTLPMYSVPGLTRI